MREEEKDRAKQQALVRAKEKERERLAEKERKKKEKERKKKEKERKREEERAKEEERRAKIAEAVAARRGDRGKQGGDAERELARLLQEAEAKGEASANGAAAAAGAAEVAPENGKEKKQDPVPASLMEAPSIIVLDED